tara:strand:- start:96 stop:632 length:537 start_codon:yes stop_codon:yes gene_type:complete
MAIKFATGTQSYPGNTVLHSEKSLNNNSYVQWNSIPAGVQRIDISFMNVSHNHSDAQTLIQIGDSSSGILTGGYTGTWMHQNLSGGAGGRQNSNGFEFYQRSAAYTGHGIAHLVLHDDGNTDYWVCTMTVGQTPSGYEHVIYGGGWRSMTGGYSLDRVRFSVNYGSFDNGQATLSYSW